MRRRRSYSYLASISAVVVASLTSFALMAAVIDGSIQHQQTSNAPTQQRQNDVETSLQPTTAANYSKWSDNSSSTGSDNGSSASASPLTESRVWGGQSDSSASGGATMSTPGVLSTKSLNKLSQAQSERVSQSSSSPIPEDYDPAFAEYGIDVREELRAANDDDHEDDVIDSRLKVSNLINGAPAHNQRDVRVETEPDGDERKKGLDRKSTSPFGEHEAAAASAWTTATEASTPTVNHSTVMLRTELPLIDDRNSSTENSNGGGNRSSCCSRKYNPSEEESGGSINNKSVFNETHAASAISHNPVDAISTMQPTREATTTMAPVITMTAASTLGHIRRSSSIVSSSSSSQSRQYTSKQYHDHHWGPFFEDPHLNRKTPNAAKADSPVQVGIHLGTEAFLNCRVGMLRDKTVMWVRKTTDKVSLLTVGNNTYSGDSRISIRFQYPNNWRLQINPVQADDAGLYMCQVSTHPPRVFATNVTILAPAIRVVDEHGHEVHDRYYKMGSAIDLTCQIATSFLAVQPSVGPPHGVGLPLYIPKATITSTLSAATTRGPLLVFPQIPKPNAIHTFNSNSNNNIHQVKSALEENGIIGQNNKREHHYDYLHQRLLWKKDNGPLPKDVQVNLSATPEWRNSRISISIADRTHSGIYSCSLLNTTLTVVNVQVLNALLPGEMPAAVQHNSSGRVPVTVLGQSPMPIILVLLFYRFLLSAHIC